MAVNYVIVEEVWCTKQYRPGCAFYEVWDVEDPANRDRPVFCQLLHDHIPPPFKQVFLNRTYRVSGTVTCDISVCLSPIMITSFITNLMLYKQLSVQ